MGGRELCFRGRKLPFGRRDPVGEGLKVVP